MTITVENREIPVLLLTGYLGSGKTTLVNRILSNKKGIKFAVIVNDIGEVNIDADLIQKGGVVGTTDDSLVPLQNGCICCTLKMDLVAQLNDLCRTNKFDYIVIEASGICEPEPIARTICSIPTFGGLYTKYGICRLDNIVTVVDAMRMQSEFDCGDTLVMKNIDEEDIENLVIQQIEFCNTVLLNKASEVSPKELERIKAIIRELQPKAEIIECNYADVELDKLLNTHLFDYDKVSASAGWIKGIETSEEDAHKAEHEEDEHGHHHHEEDDHDEDDEHEHHHEEVGGHHHHHDEDDHECCCEHHHDEDEHECCHHHDHSEEIEHANEGLSEGNKVHIGGGEHEHHHHHHHHHGLDADDVFDSIGIETVNRYTEDDIREALKGLGENIVRAKGIVPTADGSWLFFDYVPGDVDIRTGKAAYTGLITVIGEHVDVENIKTLFKVK